MAIMSEVYGGAPERSFQPERLQIETHRRLVSEGLQEVTGIAEYSDIRTGQRILTVPVQSEQAHIHTELVRRRIPVFPVLAVDDRNLLLGVPSDARTIQGSLKFIARDIGGYGEIFTQIGEVLGRCDASRVGLPEKHILGRTILEGIAFSLSDAETFGGNVHLLPPYDLQRNITKSTELSKLRSELIDSPYLTAPMADELMRATSEGWESVRT